MSRECVEIDQKPWIPGSRPLLAEEDTEETTTVVMKIAVLFLVAFWVCFTCADMWSRKWQVISKRFLEHNLYLNGHFCFNCHLQLVGLARQRFSIPGFF